MYDYIRAPERRFAPKLNHKRRQELEGKRRRLPPCWTSRREKSAQAGGLPTMAQEKIALNSFIAGFRLAWGIAMELGADGSYSYEREQEEVNRRKT